MTLALLDAPRPQRDDASRRHLGPTSSTPRSSSRTSTTPSAIAPTVLVDRPDNGAWKRAFDQAVAAVGRDAEADDVRERDHATVVEGVKRAGGVEVAFIRADADGSFRVDGGPRGFAGVAVDAGLAVTRVPEGVGEVDESFTTVSGESPRPCSSIAPPTPTGRRPSMPPWTLPGRNEEADVVRARYRQELEDVAAQAGKLEISFIRTDADGNFRIDGTGGFAGSVAAEAGFGVTEAPPGWARPPEGSQWSAESASTWWPAT